MGGWPTWRIGTNLCEVLAIAVYPPAEPAAIGLSLRLSTGAMNVVSVALVGLGVGRCPTNSTTQLETLLYLPLAHALTPHALWDRNRPWGTS